MSPGFAIVVVMALALFGVWGYFVWRKEMRRKLLEGLQLQLFLVRMPIRKQEGKEVRQEINITEQLLNALASFNKPIVFEIAVPYVGEEIHFYIAAHRSLSDAIVRNVQSLWDDAEIRPVEDFNVFNYHGVATGAWVRQKERFILPVRTYQDMVSDTFLPIVGSLSEVNEVGEGAAIQYVVHPAPIESKKRVQSALRVLKKGWKLKDILAHPLSISTGDVLQALSGKGGGKKPADATIDEQAVKALERKLSKPLYEVNVRLVASAPSQHQADALLESMTSGFAQFGSPDQNEFRLVKPRIAKDFIHQFSFREFKEDQGMVLNSEELASIFHFPTPFTTIPKIKYLKSREAAPPAELPPEGIVVGESWFRGHKRIVRMAENDRRRHFYMIGQTGTGKSNLLTTMAIQDVREGRGVALIDPHGDLVNDVLSLVPDERADDVIVFDPGDIEHPLGMNMIEHDRTRPEQKTFIVNEMVGIFDKLYDLRTTGGPMFEQYMRNALLLLMEDSANEPATLMEIARIFTDSKFRDRKLARITNPTVIDFWQREATKAGGEAALTNMTPYITSKFNAFTANDYMRVIIGQERSAFNFREVMDEGKILLVNLSKGKVGDLNANLLGMIIVGKILMAALGRVDIDQEKRKDFFLYIDEFQNFTTDSIATILSEARKYRLSLVIAHQFIAQLSERIRDAVFGNVGSTAAFRIGAPDADFLEKQFAPVFKAEDMMNIDNYNAYLKLLINGEATRSFNIKTIQAPAGDVSRADELREHSRSKYGRSREEVEREILKRLRSE